jgi:transglutaminase-like putative cysteine protease
MFAEVGGVTYVPAAAPKYKELVVTGEANGRGGGLHAWGEVWLPNKAWTQFESTRGQIVTESCYDYQVELYPANNDLLHICKSTDKNFASQCAVR